MLRKALLTFAFLGAANTGFAQEKCRQALALALDVSGSVDSREYRMQLNGLTAALSHPDVVDVLFSMPDAPVTIAVFEWSSPTDQTILLPWTAITDRTTLTTITDRLAKTQRTPSDQSTGLGAAMLFGVQLLKRQSACWKLTLDISGDGKSNTGLHPKDISDAAFGDVTINALVIGADPIDHGDSRQAEISELSAYFEAYVIHGTGRFVEVALGFEDYERAMVRKLMRELEGMALSQLDVNH
jgi:hypothetical protein